MKFSTLKTLIFLSIVHEAFCQCSIDIRTELNRTSSGSVKEPLFLKYSGSGYSLMIPDSSGDLTFKAGESALIACTSDTKPNSLSLNNKQSATIFCASGSSFNINNQAHSVSEFNECSAQITGNAVNFNSKCAENGNVIVIGFQLSDGKGFVNLFDVCYNKKKGSSIYARHVLQGRAIKSAMKSSSRPSTFKTAEVPSNIDAAKSFTKSNQMKRFEDIFNDREKAEGYLNQTYLARGHLAPDGDFLFVSWQFSTYYYINTVPQWQSINNANWKHVESAVRSKADKMKQDLFIYTGSFDVLKLNNKKISLEPDGLEVPKYTWKVVKVPSDDSGIAFLTYNNPFATSAPTSLCKDICKDYGWDWKDRKTFSKGYTICCDVQSLMNAVSVIPSEASVNVILEK